MNPVYFFLLIGKLGGQPAIVQGPVCICSQQTNVGTQIAQVNTGQQILQTNVGQQIVQVDCEC